jgi:hypothetical protein
MQLMVAGQGEYYAPTMFTAPNPHLVKELKT